MLLSSCHSKLLSYQFLSSHWYKKRRALQKLTVNTVNKAVPTLAWAPPAAISYGTPLSSTQLNATASVPGTFVYSPAAGSVLPPGSQTLSLNFTPTDNTDYTTATASVKLTVNKAVPTLAWAPPAAISYGTPLSSTQLNATASVPGTFVYSPAAGSVLPPGSQTLSLNFTPTDNTDYTTATASVKLTVNKAVPTLAWAPPAAISYGTPLSSTQLNATASVPGTFVYSPAAGSVLPPGSQTLSLNFTPTDNTDYTTATASVKLTVNKAVPTLAWAPPAAISYGTPLSSTQLNATASVPGTFVYSPAAGSVLPPGSQTLSLNFTPTDNTDYTTATASVALTVNKAVPTLAWAPPAAISYGTPLSSTQLNATASVPGTFVYSPAAGSVLPPGSQTLSLNFTPTDNTDYTTATASVALIVDGVPVNPIEFTFLLPTDAATSAGVYDTEGKLLRTLWSNQPYSAGPHVEEWDGNDDDGIPLAAGSYQIRLLYNNVSYSWGVIGNTSENWSGPNIWDTEALLPVDMAIIGRTAYVANSYAEIRPQASSFALSEPQQPDALFTLNECDQMQFVTTDGKLLYFANTGNGWAGSSAYVMALNPTWQKPYNFPMGTPSSECGQSLLKGVLDYSSDISSAATGLAVQTNGNLLAVSHGNQNVIRLFDKTTGSSLGSISISDPQGLAFAPDGDLWAISGNSVLLISCVGRYNLFRKGLPFISAPLAIAVDPSTNDVLVAEGGRVQQVKRFSKWGYLRSTYGDPGGLTDCDPTVTKSRLLLDGTGSAYTTGSGLGSRTFLAVLPDSSFWVGDPGNDRILHISSWGKYIEQISFLRYNYYIAADHGNPSRVFVESLEYAVDYTKPLVPGDPDPELGGNGSWSLVRNWSACLSSNYMRGFRAVQTFGNGRTYATVLNLDPVNTTYGPNPYELVELPTSGPLRFSGQLIMNAPWRPSSFSHEGNLTYWMLGQNGGVSVQEAYQQDLTGYDANGWPVWETPHLLASVPTAQASDPVGFSGWGMFSFPEPTTGGILATYKTNPAISGPDHHLGGVPVGGADWLWKVSPGAMLTTPDGKGTFTDVQSFGGHDGIAALVEGTNIFQGYDGQWGSFSSQWMHWSEDGLLIGQFGHPPTPINLPLTPGSAGNIATMATVVAGDNIYLYSSDEGYHPGIHQWKISGLDTIHELSGWAPLGGTVTLGVMHPIVHPAGTGHH
jgi:hypothetical protein